MGDDRWSPLDGVDLCQERRINQPRLLEELLVGPVRILCCEAVADRIVLASEQRQEQTQAEPPPGTWANTSRSGGGSISSPPCCTIRNLPPLPVLTLDWRFWSVG